jgi:hypothetical protein
MIKKKPDNFEDCDQHMGYVHKGDRMANIIQLFGEKRSEKENIFFHLLDLTLLNSYKYHCQSVVVK